VPVNFLPGGLSLSDVRALNLEYEYDPARARLLLAQAGYPHGFVLDLVSSEKRLYQAYYRVLAAQLAEIGIRCRIRTVSHPEMHRQIRHEPKPLVIYAAWRPNADAYLTRFFHSDSIIVTGSRPDTNFSCYDKIDKLIETARMEIDPDRQISLWHQAQIRILNDMAAFPIMYTKQIYIRKKYVDYGHKLVSTMALYPQFTEKTKLNMP
jgi:peptide/nickel transport system substrate-binding protein